MRQITSHRKGASPRFRTRRWFSIAAIITLISMFIVPAGTSLADGITSITITPNDVYVATNQSFTVTATALTGSTPALGVTLKAIVTGANTVSYVVLLATDSAGHTTFTYVGSSTGTDTITIFEDNNGTNTPDTGDVIGTATIHWATPTSLTLTPKEVTKSNSSPQTLTATLTDSSGHGLFGASVHCNISGTHNDGGHLTTDGDGVATFPDTFNGTGDDTVTASSGSLTATSTIHWISGGGVLLIDSSSPAPAVGSTVTITTTLTDGANNELADEPIYFSVNGVNNRSPQLRTTDASGHASFTYGSSAAGTDHITAWADFDRDGIQDSAEPSNSINVTWQDGGDNGGGSTIGDYSLSLSPSSQNRALGTAAAFSASLSNSSGGLAGVPIRYSVSGPNATSGTAYTSFGGNAVFSYVGNTNSTDTVTAYADLNGNGVRDSNEPLATATVIWGTGSPGSYGLTLAPSTQTVAEGTDASVTATFNNPFGGEAGAIIRYAISGANTDSGALLTDANGQVTIVDTGDNSGTDTIDAYVDLNNNDLQNTGEPGASATVVRIGTNLSLAPATQIVAAGSQVSLTATYTAASGSPSGATIRYAISGANPGSGSVMTDSSGHATISYAGTTPGTDTVNAYVDLNHNGTQDSGEPSASATIGLSGNAALALSPAIQNATPGVSAAVTVTLTSNNVAVAGVMIRYDITGANPQTGNVTTDSNGHAVIVYTGNNVGTDYIWAFADFDNNGALSTGEPATTVTVTWSTGGTITPPPSSNELPAAQPATPKAGCTYFSATQHNLCAGFQQYWNDFGGLAIFGMPITEEFQENGVTVQYFERARFEWHPGSDPTHFDVLLGLLGNEVTAGRQAEAPFMKAVPKAGDCTFYSQTGHNLCEGFRAYWEKYGGLDVYGYPISEEFQEVNPDTGQTYTVQYFQRARFEWHPGEWPERFDVELGRLGAQVFSMTYGTQYH
jgi:hypothetical protein